MKKHLVLAVDDDSETLDVLEDTLETLKCGPLKAANQADALKVLKSKRPCMVLLDLQIKTDRRAPPRIETGFNLLRRIRQQYPKGTLHVILISAQVDKADILNRGYRDGIDEYVSKPFDDGDLEKQIERLLQRCPVHGLAADRLAEARIFFDGKPNDRKRHLLQVSDMDVWVQAKTIEVLWTLAAERLKNKAGWLKARVVDSSKTNPHEAITRARQDLKTVCDPGKIIENNRGQYRLSIPADRIRWNIDAMTEYFPHLELPPGSPLGDKSNAD